MSRIFKSLGFLLLFYVLPLVGVPERLLDPRIPLLMLVAAAVLLTQPEVRLSDAQQNSSRDRYSMLLIMLVGGLSQVIPLIEWAYIAHRAPHILLITLGGIALIGGTAFRIWSIRVLGKFFTSTVAVSDEQRVVDWGPYSIVRHPSYLGAYVAILGSSVLLQAYVSLVIAALAMLLTYVRRIKLEESALLEQLGDAYACYAEGRQRLIPFIW